MTATTELHDPGFESTLRLAAPLLDVAAKPIHIAGGGEVRTGTASWTDPTMVAKGVFYPDGVSNAEDRLRYYATRFPLVEVDATYYALPREEQSKLWVERTPRDFVFDVKAHALMTGQPSEVKRLPRDIRDVLPDAQKDGAHLRQGSAERAVRRGVGFVQEGRRAAAQGLEAGRDLPPVSAVGLSLQ